MHLYSEHPLQELPFNSIQEIKETFTCSYDQLLYAKNYKNDLKSALVKSNKMCLTRSQKVFVEVIMILMVLFILLHVFKNYK